MPSSNANRNLRPFSPTRFGRYTLLAPLATGGMAQVFLARTTGVEGFEKLVVIKKILPHLAADEYFVDRFLDEGKIVVKLSHGSIAQVLDMGKEGEEYYIAMEFVDGKDVRKIAARCRDQKVMLPTGLALYVFVRALDALAYAHRKKDERDQDLNIVHRDVSPQNILVSYEGEVKVIDFGLAKSAQSLTRTSPSVILGKFFYMSPEQARHQPADRRSDIYATGISLWEVLAGHNPFDEVPPGEILRVVAEPNIPRLKDVSPGIPDALDAVVMKALDPDPDARFQSAEEMRGRLTAAMLEADPGAGPESLAAFMRQRFAREYENERKTIAYLSRLPAPGPAAAAEPAPVAPPAQGFEVKPNTEKDITAGGPESQATPKGGPVFGGAAEAPTRRVTGTRRAVGAPPQAEADTDPRRPAAAKADPLEFVPEKDKDRPAGKAKAEKKPEPAPAPEAPKKQVSKSRPAARPEPAPASIIVSEELQPLDKVVVAPELMASSGPPTPTGTPEPESPLTPATTRLESDDLALTPAAGFAPITSRGMEPEPSHSVLTWVLVAVGLLCLVAAVAVAVAVFRPQWLGIGSTPSEMEAPAETSGESP